MATTTPNYGWDVPNSTDYVADGAVAIETLGDDIDASLFSITSGKNVGEVYIGTYSWSNTLTTTIDNVFTTQFDEYRIVIAQSAGAAYSGLFANPRSGGADITSNITSQLIYTSGTSVLAANYNAAWRIGDFPATANGMALNQMNIFNPMNTTYKTTYVSDTAFPDDTMPGTSRTMCAGSWRVTTQMQGIKFIASHNQTAQITIYGKRK